MVKVLCISKMGQSYQANGVKDQLNTRNKSKNLKTEFYLLVERKKTNSMGLQKPFFKVFKNNQQSSSNPKQINTRYMLVWNKAKAVVMKNNKEIRRPLVHKIFPPKQNLGQKIILPNTLKEKNLIMKGSISQEREGME